MIITLCGSARFEDEFRLWNKILTIAGHLVFSISVYPSDEPKKKDWYTPGIKRQLDLVHLAKIANSNGIFVINKWGYLGESTLTEIAFAKNLAREIYFRESWGMGLCSNQILKSEPHYKGSPISTVVGPGCKDYTSSDLFGAGANEVRSLCMSLLKPGKDK